jgi:hypothetical protein
VTNHEQQCVWDVLTKQIDALKPKVHALHDEWCAACEALYQLERERNKLWRDKITELNGTL